MIAHLRKATASDVPDLLTIERDSFPHPNWSSEDFLKYPCLVAEVGHQVAGFVVVRETFRGSDGSRSEREILNVAVAPPYRRLLIATLLLSHVLHEKNATYFLEVRESNFPAQRLYRKLGFVEIGRREHYYQNPAETALVMQLK